MGRNKNNHVSTSSDEEHVDDVMPKRYSLDCHLDELFHKKDSKRVDALVNILEGFKNVEHEFVQERFATLLYRFLHSIQKGSDKEIHYACYAIGFLAIITRGEDNTHEIYEEAIPLFNQLLNKSKNPLLLGCMAIVTLFGARDVNETERTMQFLWEYINSKYESDSDADFIATAIRSWSLLLSSMDQWKFSCRYWKGAIRCFLNVLEEKNENDEAVVVAAGEALALIFEAGSIDKFWGKCDADADADADANAAPQEPSNYATREKWVKDKVLKKLVQLSVSVSDENGDWDDVVQYFKDGKFPKCFLRIEKHNLTLSTWSRKVQLKSLVNFVGKDCFNQHMLENEVMQDFFEFRPTTEEQCSDTEEEALELLLDEILVRFYLDVDRKTNPRKLLSKQKKSKRGSSSNKEETKAKSNLRQKQRSRARMRDKDFILAD